MSLDFVNRSKFTKGDKMQTYETLKHTTWECKYHVVFIPKCRKKVLYGQIRRELGVVFRELARQRESEIVEGHLMIDHVHMLISIPPKLFALPYPVCSARTHAVCRSGALKPSVSSMQLIRHGRSPARNRST
jgi:hypothetical protein